MPVIFRFLLVLVPLMRLLGTCAIAGIIAGGLGGYVLSVAAWASTSAIHLTLREALLAAVILTAFTWIALLYILVVLTRLTFSSVAAPSLVNSFLTCLITVMIARATGAYEIAWLIGMLTGVVLGRAMCVVNGKGKD